MTIKIKIKIVKKYLKYSFQIVLFEIVPKTGEKERIYFKREKNIMLGKKPKMSSTFSNDSKSF